MDVWNTYSIRYCKYSDRENMSDKDNTADRSIDESLEKEDAIATRHFGQVGTVGLERYGGYVYEEFIPDLRLPQNLKIYKEMSSNDATIGGILFLFESMMKKLPWFVKPGGDKLVDKTVAKFVKECMDDMEHSWMDFIVEALSMFIYGWSWHEIVYKIRNSNNSKYSDGRIGWAKLPIRSQNSWNGWVYDENDPDKLIGMEQIDNNRPGSTPVVIPYEKSLLFKTKEYRNSPEGMSLLRTAYRAWYFKKKIEEIEGIGIERDLAGLPVITVPEDIDLWDPDNKKGVALRTHLEKMISNIRRDKNEGVLLPANYVFTLAASTSSKQFDTNKIIDRYDQRIAMTVLADIILMGHTNSGSFALAKSKTNLLGASLEAVADNIKIIINKVAIPKLMELNTFHGYTKYPALERGEIEAPDMAKLADSMQKFRDMGMAWFPNEKTEDYLRASMGLPILTEEEKKELKAQREKELKEEQKQQSMSNRAKAEHETDDKGEFNAVYEEAGMKKLFKGLKKLFSKKEEDASN